MELKKVVNDMQTTSRFVIQKESLPARCEICHQADQLNPETGECGRCSDVSLQLPMAKPRLKPSLAEKEAFFHRLNQRYEYYQRHEMSLPDRQVETEFFEVFSFVAWAIFRILLFWAFLI